MAENKTRATDVSVEHYLAAVEPAGRCEDAMAVDALMQRVTGERPRMWGPSIIGYGHQTETYASGRVVDMPRAAFAPRKANLVFYLYRDTLDPGLLQRLGKHKTGKGCVYVNRLSDIDLGVLEEMVRRSVEA